MFLVEGNIQTCYSLARLRLLILHIVLPAEVFRRSARMLFWYWMIRVAAKSFQKQSPLGDILSYNTLLLQHHHSEPVCADSAVL